MYSEVLLVICCLVVTSQGQLKQLPQSNNYQPIAAWMEYSFDPVRRVCIFHGTNYAEFRYAETFTRPESGKCFSYRCSYTGISILKAVMGCEYGTQCIPKDGFIQENCVNFTCGVIADFRQKKYIRAKSMFHLVNDGCSKNGTCVPVGDTILVDNLCGAEECRKTPTGSTANYVFIPSNDVCSDVNGCYPEGHVKSTGLCTGERCIKTTNMTFQPRSSGCLADSKCYPEKSLRDTIAGTTCTSEQCVLDNDFTHRLVTTKIRCHDADGCHNYNYIRRDRDNCQDFICELKAGAGVWTKLDAGCRTPSGACILPAVSNFTTEVRGNTSIQYECLRQTIRHNATLVKTVTCKDKDGDHQVGFTKKYMESCYEKTCVSNFLNVSQSLGTPYDGWVLRYHGCDWGGPICALPGQSRKEEKTDHCLLMYCKPNGAYTTPTYGLFPNKELDSPVDKECKDAGGCHPAGFTKPNPDIYCAVLSCTISSSQITGVTAAFTTNYTGCLLGSGTCLNIGANSSTHTDDYCELYKCDVRAPVDDVMPPTRVLEGCWSKGRCYDSGSIISNDDCSDSICEAGQSYPLGWAKGDIFQCKNSLGCHSMGSSSFNNETCYLQLCGQNGVWTNQNQGCMENGHCVAPDTVVDVDECTVRVCSNNAFSTQYKGCLTPTTAYCVPGNKDYFDNVTCIRYTCTQFPQPYGVTPGATQQTQECKGFDGCVAVGQSVVDKTTCKQTTCLASGTFQQDNWVCQDGDGCYDVGHSQQNTGMCESYTCLQVNNVVTWKKSFWGCMAAGGCLPSGEERTVQEGLGCSELSCVLPTDIDAYIVSNPTTHVAATPTSRGCWSEGTCYQPNTLKDMGQCKKEKCEDGGGGFYSWVEDDQSTGCFFSGKCYQDGDQRKDNSTCAIVTCQVNEWMPSGNSEGCAENGVCYNEGHVQLIPGNKCFAKLCLSNAWANRFKGCLGPPSKVCLVPNETFTDVAECKTFFCPLSSAQYNTVPGLTTAEQGCKINTECHDVGYKSQLNTVTCTREICTTGGVWASPKTACEHDSVCHEVGSLITTPNRDPKCFRRRCRFSTSSNSSYPVPTWEFVQFGCVYGETCMQTDTTFTSRTGDETCGHVTCDSEEKAWKDEDSATDVVQGVAQYQGCYFEDVCYTGGAMIYDNKCSNITCVKTTPTDYQWDRFTFYGCDYSGECFSPGVTWINVLLLKCTCYRGIGPVCV